MPRKEYHNKILRKVFFYNETNKKYNEMCDFCWANYTINMKYFKMNIPDHISIYEDPKRTNDHQYPFVKTLSVKPNIPLEDFYPPYNLYYNSNNKQDYLNKYYKEELEFFSTEMTKLTETLGDTFYVPQVMSRSLHNNSNRNVSNIKIEFSHCDIKKQVNSSNSSNYRIINRNRVYLFKICLESSKHDVNDKGILVTKAIGLIEITITPSQEQIVSCIINGFKNENNNDGRVVSKGFTKNTLAQKELTHKRKQELVKMTRDQLKKILDSKGIKYNTNNRQARIEKLGITYNNKQHGNDLVELILNNELNHRNNKTSKTNMLIFEMEIKDTELTVGKCIGIFSPEEELKNESLEGYEPTFQVFYKDRTEALKVNNRLTKNLPSLPSNVSTNKQYLNSFFNKFEKQSSNLSGTWKNKNKSNITITKFPNNSQIKALSQKIVFFKIDAIKLIEGFRNKYHCELCNKKITAKSLIRDINQKHVMKHNPKCMNSIELHLNSKSNITKIEIFTYDGTSMLVNIDNECTEITTINISGITGTNNDIDTWTKLK